MQKITYIVAKNSRSRPPPGCKCAHLGKIKPTNSHLIALNCRLTLWGLYVKNIFIKGTICHLSRGTLKSLHYFTFSYIKQKWINTL